MKRTGKWITRNGRKVWIPHNSSSLEENPKDRYVWYDHDKAKKNAQFENLAVIPRNAPQTIKYCTRCHKSFDSGQSKGGSFMSGLLCNGCHAKGLRPSGYPAHWVWNKMSLEEKQKDLKGTKENIVYDPNNPNALNIFSKGDFDKLPFRVREKLRHKWGVSPE